MKRKVAFSFVARLALAAAVVFAAGRCPAATFAKASASRGGEKKYVTVEWKKVKGVSGYQISVSPKRSKTKIAATAGAKSVKKTVKLSKSKKQFVKVRSYVTINNKRIYSNWSPVRATK